MKKRRYWVGIINESNFETLLEKKIFGLKLNSQKKTKNLFDEDKIIFYIIGRKIAGTFEVKSKHYKVDRQVFKDSFYPLIFDLDLLGKVNMKDFDNSLIERLSFIKNKKRWSGHFQGKSIIEISEIDFNKLKDYLER